MLRLLVALLSFASFALCQGPGTITTVAGNGSPLFTGDGGPATAAAIGGGGQSLTVALDAAGNLYIADQANSRIRRVNSAGIISTFGGGGASGGLGDGGPATSAQIFPNGIAIDSTGNVYIASGAQVRRVGVNGIITTIAGSGSPGNGGDGGPATSAQFNVAAITVDPAGNLYIADSLANRVRKVSPAGVITAFAGSGAGGFSGDGGPATAASLFLPQGLAADAAGNIYFADSGTRIRKVTPAGIISTVAGNGAPFGIGEGVAATATGMGPTNVVVDSAGAIYFSDTGVNRVRRISPSGVVNTIAGVGIPGFLGDGGPAINASLFGPRALALDAAGNLYVADNQNYRIRKLWGVAAPPGPSIAPGGVVNGASFLPDITPNGWATIVGSNLSATTATWDAAIVEGRLPTTLEGVSVTIDGKAAYIAYVSPTQINLLVPGVSVGPLPVVVTAPSGVAAPFQVVSRLYDAALIAWPGSQAVATRQDFSLAARTGTFAGLTTAPAKPGEVIILWGVGFGPTAPAIPWGTQVPATSTHSTTIPPIVTVNGLRATVYGAALAPGFAGLYQVAIEVPPTLPDGNWPVVVTIGGRSSPSSVELAVRR